MVSMQTSFPGPLALKISKKARGPGIEVGFHAVSDKLICNLLKICPTFLWLILYRVDDYWFWVPVIGQLCGGVLGALLYLVTIELHHPKEDLSQLTNIEVKNINTM